MHMNVATGEDQDFVVSAEPLHFIKQRSGDWVTLMVRMVCVHRRRQIKFNSGRLNFSGAILMNRSTHK